MISIILLKLEKNLLLNMKNLSAYIMLIISFSEHNDSFKKNHQIFGYLKN